MTAAILPQFDPSEVRNTPDATGRVPQCWLDSHGVPFSPVAVSTTAVVPFRYEPKRPLTHKRPTRGAGRRLYDLVHGEVKP